MEIIGYIASILIGIALGLIGGGGSILTVPVLVYLFAIDTVLATTYSLFIVGLTSLAGSFSYFRRGLIHVKMAIYFGIPSISSVFIARHFVIPVIPENIAQFGNFILSRNTLLMGIFALLMIFAAYSMISTNVKKYKANAHVSSVVIIIQGTFIGLVTGLIGAGGGFLIIPALVNFLKLPIKSAIGTSLLIIAVNSLAGFWFSIDQPQIQWPFLLTVTSVAIIGIFIGSYLATKIEGKKLKPAFGWFVLAMGTAILIREIICK